jgi:hypothetical protein
VNIPGRGVTIKLFTNNYCIQQLWNWLTNLSETNMLTLVIGLGAFIILFGLKFS